ncbi:cellulase family glycosylhydrolase [Gordonia sp. (in: high G+C Gram-positive bacteria)]|uniref:glycoside hydrolase family 5 protein n=1 Tax=Gordonia sp. (in: high G+C Gram-positive bacteria) TaxID=84139 RepID=UPI00169E2C98|nr:cellulase family glycosylhydrolase [Gordonia sp. (in: high G+C Gram-positive bacteria)]NLG45660.1 glycoside hydrolase family 5 protein [Gordonia sp. (in: high G+C Gram-positive bacteria)]
MLAASTLLAGGLRRPLDAGSMPRSAIFLDGWFAALVGAVIAAVIGAVVGLVTGDGFGGDLWPLMALYVRLADMLAFAVCFGWIVGLALLLRPRRVWVVAAAIGAVALVVVGTLSGPVVRDAATAVPAKADRLAPLTADGIRIVDDAGRDVLLRGVNVNQLVDFYAKRAEVPSTTPLTAADFNQIASYGFNVVRLGISWSALEPTRGQYDEDYVRQIRTAVDQAADVGLYTVIDMHQDGWSAAPTPEGENCRPGTEPMWGYDGAPAWATVDDGAPRCQFTGRDISPAGDRAFENFYHNTDGIQDHLVRAWGRIGEEFGNDPAVAGFDLLNEPGFGESAPVTTTVLLGRFYGRAIDALRDAGARQLVFFEPSLLWSGMAFEATVPADFTRDGNIVFAPHLYAESITMDRSLGLPPFVGIERGFELAARAAERLGVPLWSGEYGYWGDDRIGRLARYAATEDEFRIGGVYWVWKQSCGDPQNGIGPIGDGLIPQDCATGEFRAPDREVIDILSRAYPRRTPGRLESLTSQGRTMSITGSGDQQGCELEVWVPGAGAPKISSTGVTDVRVRALGTGHLVTGCATGGFELATS